MKSTRYYDQHADVLSKQYDALDTVNVHGDWIRKYLPREPGFACDIGAGSGRDANWLARKGWDVVAVEPSESMREMAMGQSHARVTWLDDGLPSLSKLRGLAHRFDLILLSAVWMHLPESTRERAFRILSDLLKPSGVLVINLRHGADDVENSERGFHKVSAEKLKEYARYRAVILSAEVSSQDLTRPNVTWETLIFSVPDDGTGSLPLLRHIIVNDDKSSSYKLGLLRILTRIAETAPGIVVKQTDEYVDIPLGILGLYWLKQYKPLLLTHRIPQHPNKRQGYGFAGTDFHRLGQVSNYDLRVGARFNADLGGAVTGAIRDACKNITQMPVKYITYPGQNRPVFESDWNTVRKSRGPVTLSRDYLREFGVFRIPAQLWQTFGQYACWIEPAILREWTMLTGGWAVADYKPVDVRVFEWEEGKRDTRVAATRFQELREKGFEMPCVWSARKVKSPDIDHCFPWSRWLNNDLWNLVPASAQVNASKADKLPSAQMLSGAQDRIFNWWQQAYMESALKERFLIEAGSSLPRIAEGELGLEEIYTGMLHQRARLKSDQQLMEWSL